MNRELSVLFVDDEANYLEDLRQCLLSQDQQWTLHLVSSAEEGLTALNTRAIDAVVIDVNMPDFNGVEFSRQATELQPACLCFGLSRHYSEAGAMGSVGALHQLISKPCPSEELIETVERALKLRNLLQARSLTNVIGRLGSLPSLPKSYILIQEQLNSDLPQLAEVSQAISSDLSMSSKILHLVNSGFFETPRHISSPGEAVQLLGLDSVAELVLIVSIFSQLTRNSQDGEELFEHCTEAGSLSRKFAKSLGLSSVQCDFASIAGSLHDLGKLLLQSSMPRAYQDTLRLARAAQLPDWRAEKEAFGTTHAEIGAYLLALWQFPDPVVEAVAYHHCPRQAKHQEVTPLTAVYVANRVLHGDPRVFDTVYLKSLGLPTQLEAWTSKIERAASA